MVDFTKNEFFVFLLCHFLLLTRSFGRKKAENPLKCFKKQYVRLTGTLSGYERGISNHHCKYIFHRTRSWQDKMQFCF